MATQTVAREFDPIENPTDTDPNPGPIDLPVVRTILDDISAEVAAYLANYVRLEIVDISLDGDIVNTAEEGSFRVKVTNNGPLTMKDVRLKAVARNGAEVKSGSAGAPFEQETLSSNIIETIAGEGGSDDNSALFIFEAPNVAKPDGTPLVDVTVAEWNAAWDYILNRRSGASTTPMVTFESSVEVDD